MDYVNRQAADITISATSLEIARFLLIDGSFNSTYGGFPLNTNSDAVGLGGDGNGNGDNDGAPTNLTSITLHVTNPSSIRRIALYNVNTGIEIAEQDVAALSLNLCNNITRLHVCQPNAYTTYHGPG